MPDPEKNKLDLKKTDLKKRNKIFFDRWAKSYDRFIFGWWLRYIQRKVFHSWEIKEDSLVLDVGCGTGYMLLLLSKKITTGRIVGVDLSSAMIAQAIQKINNYPNIELRQAEVEKIPYANNSFNYIFSTEAFHHFPEPEKALQEMKRVLKEEGKIIIADINIPPLFLTNRLFKLEPGFVRVYTQKESSLMARKNNLRIVQRKRIGLFGLMLVMEK